MLIIDMPMPKEKYVNVRIFAGGTATVSTDEKPYYKEMPVGELVTCGECKHRDPEDKKCDHGWMYFSFPRPDDGYCEHGERKEKTDEAD